MNPYELAARFGEFTHAERTTPTPAIRNPTPISMQTPYAIGGNGSVPRNKGATVTSVASAPTKKTIAPT
ncbi:hypothetical protein GCM10010264_12510 [Streptomyces globisporus]|nr:hypothetical protein GCM10010264_12510 [Streptomyces globisporus]